jgi:hypothetical protein
MWFDDLDVAGETTSAKIFAVETGLLSPQCEPNVHIDHAPRHPFRKASGCRAN